MADNEKILKEYVKNTATEITDRLVIPLIDTRVNIQEKGYEIEIETKEYIAKFVGFKLKDIKHINGYTELAEWDWDFLKEFAEQISYVHEQLLEMINNR
ncbi:MAG: hypothetical protein IKS79_01550 [Bacteroidales bacterium]|nr:hypothetical protein [Bacteroidales bacterium]